MWSDDERVREKDIKRYMEDLHKIVEMMEKGRIELVDDFNTIHLELTVTLPEAYNILSLLMWLRGYTKPPFPNTGGEIKGRSKNERQADDI